MRHINVYTGVVLVLGSSLLFACGSSSSAGSTAPTGTAGTDSGGSAGTSTTGKGGATTGTGGGTTAGTGGTATGTGGSAGGSAGTAAAGKGGTGGTTGKGGAGGTTGKGGSAAGGAPMGMGGMAGMGGMMIMAACDPVKKTGCTGTKKCVSEPAGMDTVSGCEDPGAGPPVTVEGADCKRTSLGIGDNCAPGMICTLRGVLDGDSTNKHTQCRKYCVDDTQCSDSQLCNNFTADGFGVCIDACLPFTACAPASQSMMGMGGAAGAGAGGAAGKGGAGGGAGGAPTVSCSDIYRDNAIDPMTGMAAFDFFGCKLVGSGAIGDVCMTSKDCGNNQFCGVDPSMPGAMTGICTEWCQLADPMAMPPIAEHACTKMGQACVAMNPGEINICM